MLEVNFKDSRGDWSATLPLTQQIGFSPNLKSSICFLLQPTLPPTSLQHTHKYQVYTCVRTIKSDTIGTLCGNAHTLERST